MKRPVLPKLALVFVLIGIMTMMGVMTSCSGTSASAESMTTKAAQQADKIEVYGTVKAEAVEDITLEFNAPVRGVHIREGERVKLGQPLVTLDLSEMTAQMENKKLELGAQQKDISLNLSNSGPDMAKLLNDLQSAKDVYNKDKEYLDSRQKLFEQGSLSQTELDAAKRQVDADSKNIKDAEYAIAALKNSKSTQKVQKASGTASLESELGLLTSKLSRPYFKGSDVVSDVKDGIAYEICYVPGDIAGPQKKLLSILDLNSLVVVANVPEEFIKDVKLGCKATFVPTADKSRQYTGVVTFISGKAVQNNGETLIPVTIKIDNRDDFLLPEFSTDVSIAIAQ